MKLLPGRSKQPPIKTLVLGQDTRDVGNEALDTRDAGGWIPVPLPSHRRESGDPAIVIAAPPLPDLLMMAGVWNSDLRARNRAGEPRGDLLRFAAGHECRRYTAHGHLVRAHLSARRHLSIYEKQHEHYTATSLG